MNKQSIYYAFITVLSIAVGLVYYYSGASLMVQVTGALMVLYSMVHVYEVTMVEKPNIKFLRFINFVLSITVTVHWIYLLNQPFVALIIGIIYYIIFSLCTDLTETHLEFERIRGKYNG